jgi:SPP1 gp7 family putative phage head morphogenesis protein
MPRTNESQAERRARQRAEEESAEKFSRSRKAEASYGHQLRLLARQVARIIEAIVDEAGDDKDKPHAPQTLARLSEALRAYATAIAPWARSQASRMIAEVNRRDKTAWAAYTKKMGFLLRKELQSAPIGDQVRALMALQVELITSLPLDAAERVHEKTLEAITLSGRYPEQVAEIKEALAEAHPYQTEQWLKNRATLIARTETARTASVLTQARAEYVGSDSYVWKTAGDWKVRPSHRRLEGSVQRWDTPPLSDPPDHHSHPGQIFNCRCVALPIIPGVASASRVEAMEDVA